MVTAIVGYPIKGGLSRGASEYNRFACFEIITCGILTFYKSHLSENPQTPFTSAHKKLFKKPMFISFAFICSKQTMETTELCLKLP